ncbi:ribonuclease H2 subunit C isoform X2 [Harpegnathos saltator]|uniref:ribonuclease H2 subunit C isoform X2 n=1 Tax=Harpegnathos saltator TaxID=610380 RepID=UPI00058FAC8A|nr:ribonuclease H2 subunit C isoform X2 [Harpegnathos saltator]XP_025158583.1 ribonuclease H2 subunit C isoform X2 [Harpegnathos saltator]
MSANVPSSTRVKSLQFSPFIFSLSLLDRLTEYYECSFRGYPLQGKKITVPAGYKGMIFMENKKTDTEGKNRNLYRTGTFSQFTYWNYDRIPSKNDALSAALDWIDIADALHTPET